jgi:hypothetical protein
MLRHVKDLRGFALLAVDGGIGKGPAPEMRAGER